MIGDKELKQYVSWRRDYYHGKQALPVNAKINPTDKTIQFDVGVGRSFLRFATEKGWRGSKPMPTFTYTAKKKRVRPAFEDWEYADLSLALQREPFMESFDETASDKTMRRIFRASAMNELLHNYILILGATGMRVGEANNLKIRDIHRFRDTKDRFSHYFKVFGKTGEREVYPRAGVAWVVEKQLGLREGASHDDYFFVMPESKSKIKTLADQFDSLLRNMNLSHSSNGEKYCLYSLRHFYAVTSLRSGKPIYDVASNMGASVEIIQAYYGKHLKPRVVATRLGDSGDQDLDRDLMKDFDEPAPHDPAT